MPYFHNNYVNLLFIHIPKTGGSSLEIYFSKKFTADFCILISKSEADESSDSAEHEKA